MGRVTVDIKEWVANGRFEGEQRLHNREGTYSKVQNIDESSIFVIFLFSTVYFSYFNTFLFYLNLQKKEKSF